MISKYSSSDEFTYLNKNVVQKRIKELNTSLDKIANEASLSAGELYNLLTHKTRISKIKREKLSKALNITPSSLVDYWPSNNNESSAGYFKISDIAKKLDCSTATIRKIVKQLDIPMDFVGKNNAWMFSASKVDRILSEAKDAKTSSCKKKSPRSNHHSRPKHICRDNDATLIVIYTTLNSILENQVLNQKQTIKQLAQINSTLNKLTQLTEKLEMPKKHFWQK